MKEPRTLAEALDRIAELDEEIVYLKGELGVLVDEDVLSSIRLRWSLTLSEARLLWLANRRYPHHVTIQTLYAAFYDNADDAPAGNIFSVFAWKIRKAVGRENLPAVHGRGYRVSAELHAEIAEVTRAPASAERVKPPLMIPQPVEPTSDCVLPTVQPDAQALAKERRERAA